MLVALASSSGTVDSLILVSKKILAAYYSIPLSSWSRLTFDYQFIVNPAYNRDRGPVSVIGTRLRSQF